MTAPDVEQDTTDFDAFWSSHSRQQTARILGEDIPIPGDVPLWLVMRSEGKAIQDASEVRRMVAELYGDNMLTHWIDRGMGTKQLSILLAWTVARAQGAKITFADAADRVERVMANPPANNRQEKRAQSKGKKKRR